MHPSYAHMRMSAYDEVMNWWRRRRQQPRNTTLSISDPALIEFFNLNTNYAGVQVGEFSALGLSAVFRSVALISGTIAGLPMRTLRDVEGTRTRVNSFLDDPGAADGLKPFNWRQTVLLHMLLHGNAYLQHRYNGAGGLVGLRPVHPLAVTPEWADRPGGKLFRATLVDGSRKDFDSRTMTQVMGLSLDGLAGLSPISIARNGLGTAIAADRAAAKVFATGALHSGMVTPEEDVTEDEAKVIKASLNAKVSGWEKAGEIAVVNRRLKFTPWTMSLEDAQFLQSRAFQIEEIARWYGVPPHLLGQTEKQTSWGTGVAEQNRGLSRYTLSQHTTPLDQALSGLLPAPRFVETDYAGLLKPAPEQEIPLLISQVEAGLMTPNEFRKFRGMDPLPGGDELRVPSSAAAPESEPEEVPA